eukprot:scaffold147446_cov12-Tisochrysis_lutea.AAC.1
MHQYDVLPEQILPHTAHTRHSNLHSTMTAALLTACGLQTRPTQAAAMGKRNSMRAPRTASAIHT